MLTLYNICVVYWVRRGGIYYQCIVGIASFVWEDIMTALRRYQECIGVTSLVYRGNIIIVMEHPKVIMIFPQKIMISPQCTKQPPMHCTYGIQGDAVDSLTFFTCPLFRTEITSGISVYFCHD